MLACQVIEIQEAKKYTTVEALWEACLFSCKWGTPYWRCVVLWWAWLPIVSELYSIWILTCWDHCFITLGDLYFRMSRNIHLFVVALRDIPENSCGGDWRWHWLRPVLIICHFLVCFLDKLLSLETSLSPLPLYLGGMCSFVYLPWRTSNIRALRDLSTKTF